MRRIVDVRAENPKTVDEAIQRRNSLIEDVQKIQAQLGRIEGDPEWRRSAIHALNTKQGELRRIKDWLRQNDDRKTSEWQLLSRAYHMIDGLRQEHRDPAAPVLVDGEIDDILDEIEKTVPGKYLEKGIRR